MKLKIHNRLRRKIFLNISEINNYWINLNSAMGGLSFLTSVWEVRKNKK